MGGQRLTAWKALHAATLGAAQALSLEHEIGSFEPGRIADVCVWDWSVEPVGRRRMEITRSLHEKVFAWMTLADDRHLVETWIAGLAKHRRPGG